MLRCGLTLIGLLSLVVACAPASAAPRWTYPPASSPGAQASPAAPVAPPSPSAPVAPSGETLEIEAFDLGFKPAVLEVPAAGRYEIKLNNTGAAVHDITFPTGEVATAQPGETASVEVDIPAGGTTFLCSIPGHAEAGMTGEVDVGRRRGTKRRPERARWSGTDDGRQPDPESSRPRPVRPDRTRARCQAPSTTSISS